MSKAKPKANAPIRAGYRKGPQCVPQELVDPNFVLRWVTNIGYNVEQRKEQGYQFIPSSELSRLKTDVGEQSLRAGSSAEGSYITKKGGTDDYGDKYDVVLMRIPKQRYDELVAEDYKKVEEIDKKLGRHFDKEGFN